jgi:ubiquinone/menaquinone biosynthesis C-methylase UbiE
MATVLHVGCGANPLPTWLDGADEVRLDIDPDCEPHIIASMTEMGDIGPYDLIYCSHALEHLYPHEVDQALGEFVRVLKPGGSAMVFVPDLEGVQPTDEPLYESPSGPICGRDMYYGLARYIEQSPFMAHHCGFVRDTLRETLRKAGFAVAEVRRLSGYNLFAMAVRT